MISPQPLPRRVILATAGVYALAGAACFFLSDWLTGLPSFPPEARSSWEQYDAWLFLLFSALYVIGATWWISNASRASGEYWRSIVEDAQQGFWLIDDQGKTLYVNRVLADMLGYTPEEMLDHTPLEFADPDSREVFETQIGTRDSPGIRHQARQPRQYELTVKTREGKPLTALVHATSIWGESGQLVASYAFVTDLTEIRNREQQLRRAATVFDHTVEGILVTDSAQRIVTVNPAFTRITGYTEDEVRGSTPAVLHSGVQSKQFYESMWSDLESRGVWQGEIWNRRKDGEIYPEWLTVSEVRDATGALVNYVGVFADMTEAHQAQEELSFHAYRDHLTGLANRALFQERLNHALSTLHHRRRHLGVVMLDLVGFGAINDSLGTQAGDEVLIEAARSLDGALRSGDTVARPGGDEYWILLEDLGQREDVGRVLRNVLSALHEPMTVAGQTVRLTARVGAAVAPDDGSDPEELVQSAATALHRAQQADMDPIQYYHTAMHDQVRRRVSLEEGLKVAIDQEQLRVWFQPQVDLVSGAVKGAEALVRWEHPQWGLVSPGDFIPIAEETGLILPLGAWILNRALDQLAQWRACGLPLDHVAVNVSAAQLRSADFYDTVHSALQRTGVPPECLELEITEQGFLGNVGAVADTIDRLANLGTRLAIDDFGTGYSSLAYLKRLPLDTLKIDKAFVDGLPDEEHDRSIVEAILAVSRALELQVVAEGVEHESQAAWLREHGVPWAQGFLYTRPMPAEDLRAWMEAGTSDPA
ncbi:MAG: EAL domain-containing protein [Halofilum sp. (in: g-proteobacteria)]|nr:EAL domain-containing protein [Halofilum sp. (in: g-proteobacteria)]